MNDIYRPGDTIYSYFGFENPSGVGTPATSITPVVFRNQNLDYTGTPTFTHIGTGQYRNAFTIPSIFDVGDQVTISAAATLTGTPRAPTPIWEGRLVGWTTDSHVTAIALGPFKITTQVATTDGKVECFVGDSVSLICQMTDFAGTPINCDGASMGALVTDSSGATSVTPTVSEKWDEAGWFNLAFDAPASAGTYQLTLRRTVGSTVQTAGPLIIKVKAR